MSDMSPSPPSNRRRLQHRRAVAAAAAATAGSSSDFTGGATLRGGLYFQPFNTNSPNTSVSCGSNSSLAGTSAYRSAGTHNGESANSTKNGENSVANSNDDFLSDIDGSPAAAAANSPDTSSTTRRRRRRNARQAPAPEDASTNDENDADEPEESREDVDQRVTIYRPQHDSSSAHSFYDSVLPSVTSKRRTGSFNKSSDVDGNDMLFVGHHQHQTQQRASTTGASALSHPLHNASAVARSQAVGAAYDPLHNWQATKHTLKERFSFMFGNEILADVHFIVGRTEQRQRIPAHRFVLSVGSAVFDAMFNGAMARNQMDEGDIELPDVEPSAFLALLKFLYSDDVEIGPESVMTTLYTAKKYAVPALESACVEFLKRALNADNAFMLLTQARLFDELHLAALCLEIIDKHTNEALNAEGFTEIDLDTLCAVLERDSLRIREVALFQAVVRWSAEECRRQNLSVTPENQRQVLSRSLQLIRFPLMTVEEFAQTAAQSGILSDREVVNLFLYFTVNPKPSAGFLDVPRCCVTGKEQVVNRFQRIEGRWGYSGTPDRIKFNVDRRVFVVGFGLYGSIHCTVEYHANIQIIHCGTGKVLGSNETTFQCDGSANTYRVLFREPIEISPCVTYIASACLKGPDSHYGTKGLRRIVQQSPGNGCVTFQFTYAAGNNNGTSVEDGQIPEIIYYTKLCA